MGRGASILPRWLPLPLLVLALASVPTADWVPVRAAGSITTRAAAPTVPGAVPPVRIVFLDTPRAAAVLARRPAPLKLSFGGPPGGVSQSDRISMVLGPVFPRAQRAHGRLSGPAKPPDPVRVDSQVTPPSPAAKGLPSEGPPAGQVTSQPDLPWAHRAVGNPEQTSRKPRISVTIEPADVLPGPDFRPDTAEDRVTAPEPSWLPR